MFRRKKYHVEKKERTTVEAFVKKKETITVEALLKTLLTTT